jgi:hypothetical protein
MDAARAILSALGNSLLRPFAGVPEIWSLLPLGVGLGCVILYAARRLSNQSAIRDAKNRIQAHLYELRLFADEPKLIWRAQTALLRQNVRYIGLMLAPAAVLTAPLAIMVLLLDCFYGVTPLEPGRSSIVTVQLTEAIGGPEQAPVLRLPDGFVLETPAVRIPAADAS